MFPERVRRAIDENHGRAHDVLIIVHEERHLRDQIWADLY